jgi:chromosome segregation ATPase
LARKQTNGQVRSANEMFWFFSPLHLFGSLSCLLLNSAIFQVAQEICCTTDNSEVAEIEPSDLWDTILAMTKNTITSQSVEPPRLDTPRLDTPKMWSDYKQHAAIANLIDTAVSHKNLQQRKTYIERIMNLPSIHQRSLMALLERQKKQSVSTSTPSKDKKSTVKTRTSAKKRTKTGETTNKPSSDATPTQKPTPNERDTTPDSGSRPPFSPRHSNNRTTPDSSNNVAQLPPSKSDSRGKGRGLFSTPRCLTRQRSFEDAFGSTPQLPDSANPSPKRQASGPQAFFSPGLGDTAEYEKAVQEMRERNQTMESDLEKSRQRETDLAQKLEDVESNFRQEMMKVERDARLREEECKDTYETEMTTLQHDLANVSQKYEQAKQAKQELAGVKDEMELMLHTKGMLAETTEKLRNYKERLQQCSDVKDALQREEQFHSKSVEECLRLDNELKILQPLKHQLEDYKTRAADVEVKFAESQDELRKWKHESLTLASTNEELLKGSESQQEEIEELRKRVQTEERAREASAGVGDGMSELNPELKEEVLRLRNENNQLRAFKNKRETDSVQKMEQKMEDLERLQERYKNQYLSTKGKLEDTQVELKDALGREAKLEKDLSEWTCRAQEAQERADGLSRQLRKCQDDLQASRAREENLDKELVEWAEQAKTWRTRADDLAGKLQKCSEDLHASITRESNLEEELANQVEKAKESQQRANSLSAELDTCTADLVATRERESNLNKEVLEWTEQAKLSQERANDVSEQLHKSSTELTSSRNREASLEKELSDWSKQAKASNEQVHDLSQQLEQCVNNLKATRETLNESQSQELALRDDLADVTTRAEDSESVSTQRMELLQITRQKLTVSHFQVETLELKNRELELDRSTWTEKARAAYEDSGRLETELGETKSLMKSTLEKLSTSQVEVANLQNVEKRLTAEVESWNEKATSAESLTDLLQEELVQTREILNKKQTALETSQDEGEMLKVEVENAETKVKELVEELDRACKERQEAIDETAKRVEATRAERTAKADNDIHSLRSQLEAQLEEELQYGAKMKQELFHTQETLNETHVSLGSSQHREKMFKHEVAKLQDRQKELEDELETAKTKSDDTVEESEKSLEATREVLNAKGKKDMDELQHNMNMLLEGERKAKRLVDEKREAELKALREESNKRIAELEEEAARAREASKKETQDQLEHVRSDHEKQIEEAKKTAKEENEKLMTKGKAMLKNVDRKAQEEIQAAEEECAALQENYDHLQKEKQAIANAYKNKVTEYKKKLQITTGRIVNLTQETDDLQDSVKAFEREKFKLQEENDRYRRQLGGRFGTDAKVQNQLEMIQKEFKNALEETRELKRKLNQDRSTGFHSDVPSGSLPAIDEDSDALEKNYSRDAVNQSTLVQLRTEYEETIEELNDEKRELVMKNSAAITDVQKAEKRAWEADQDNASLKHENTSLLLQIERMNMTTQSMASYKKEPTQMSTLNETSFGEELDENDYQYDGENSTRNLLHVNTANHWETDNGTSLLPRAPDSSMRVLSPSHSYHNGANRNSPALRKSPKIDVPMPSSVSHFSQSPINKGENTDKQIPSFAQYGSKSSAKDGPSECKQS